MSLDKDSGKVTLDGTVAEVNVINDELNAAIQTADAALPANVIVVAGDDGTNSVPLQIDASGYLKIAEQGTVTTSETPGTVYYVFESAISADATPPTAFVVDGTGWEFNRDINAALGANATHGYIACDGPGDVVVAFSHNDTYLGAALTIKSGEVMSFEGMSVDTVEINAAANTASAVRLAAW